MRIYSSFCNLFLLLIISHVLTIFFLKYAPPQKNYLFGNKSINQNWWFKYHLHRGEWVYLYNWVQLLARFCSIKLKNIEQLKNIPLIMPIKKFNVVLSFQIFQILILFILFWVNFFDSCFRKKMFCTSNNFCPLLILKYFVHPVPSIFGKTDLNLTKKEKRDENLWGCPVRYAKTNL